MAVPKAKTLQQTLGFVDEDLKRTSHDEIIAWCQNNAKAIVFETLDLGEYNEKYVASIKDYLLYYLNLHYLNTNNGIIRKSIYSVQDAGTFKMSDLSFGDPIVKRGEIKIEKITWEFLIRSYNENRKTGYTSTKDIGFIDLLIQAHVPSLSFKGVTIDRSSDGKILSMDIVSRDNLHFEFDEAYYQLNFLVEAKTRMPTLGELFRQLNLYKQYRPTDRFVVVCPDDSSRKTIEEQGFYFIKYQ